MAPQTKRTSSNPCKEARSPAKKVKTQAPEKTVDLIDQQLAPILLALASSEKSAASCDTLQAALPYCLAGVKEERHAFQTRILQLTASALSGLEDEARASLVEVEVAAEKVRAESALAQADFESKQLAANTKKEECDAKALEVENFGKDVEAAKGAVKAEIEKKDAFIASKATICSEQEEFQKVLIDLWQPLKASSFMSQQWRKRDKCCTELVEKITPLSLEESLVEALKATLKLKVEQRCAFAQRTLSCVEEGFDKHQALLADRVAGLESEEAARDAGVAEAEANLGVARGKLAEQDKEDIELQNAWVDLENTAAKAKTSAATLNAQVQDALEEMTTWKVSVDACLAHSASFAALCDPPAVVAPPAVTAEEEAEHAPDCAMDTEAEAVAVAA